MILKQLDFGEESRSKLKKGITQLAKAVKSTLGPRGRYVIIEDEDHTHGMTVTKDGVTVANAVNLFDPVENMAVRMVRQAAQKTASTAGDGTTTSVILTEAIINEAEAQLKPEHNVIEVMRHIKSQSSQIVKNLTKRSKKMTSSRLYQVATVSANNDKVLGRLIGDAYRHVGDGGVVTVEESRTSDTYIDTIEGIRIERGFTSEYQITNESRNESTLENASVIISDKKIESARDIEHILKELIEKGNATLFIIAELSTDTMSALNYNASKGFIKFCNVIPPSNGIRRVNMLKDLATTLGGRYISERQGNEWGTVKMEDLGKADKVVSTESRTVIIKKEMNAEAVYLLSDLKNKLSNEERLNYRAMLTDRISCLSGLAAIVYVGAESDIERKEKADRVDDSVFATRAAMEEGILPGGGIALMEEVMSNSVEGVDDEEITANSILSAALKIPFKQIIINAGGDADKSFEKVADKNQYGYGLDVKTGEYGDMLKMGIIDPTKVTKEALKNAVSVATTIIGSETSITNMREK
jgi:chaperonin GroEL